LSFWSDLKGRKVLRTAGAYVAGSLALLGALDLAASAFDLSDAWLRFAIIATISGLPVALTSAWFFEARPEPDELRDSGSSPATRWKGMAMGVVFSLVIFLLLATTVGLPEQTTAAGDIPGFGGRGAIAVMPFENLSDDGAHVHITEGIPEDIATSLQNWGVFPVIARSSTRAYAGSSSDLPTLASLLGVRYMLVGSVRTSGDSVRVSTQLVDAETDRQLWAEQFDRGTEDIFAIQDEITEQVVTAIAPEMTRSEMRRARGARPDQLATWELMMRAQALILEGTYEDVLAAEALLKLAIEREPGYALAYARLAEVGHDVSNNYSRIVGNEQASASLARGLDHAREAVRLDPSLVDAHVWYGHLLLHHRQVAAGLEELKEAVRINPSHAQARAELSLGLSMSGQVADALEQLAIAFRLSPNDPRNDRIRTFEALAHLYAGNYEQAVASARKMIDQQRGSAFNIVAYVVEISALVRLGRLPQAQEVVREFTSYHGPLDWAAIERAAWSEAQLNDVRNDLRIAGMIPADSAP